MEDAVLSAFEGLENVYDEIQTKLIYDCPVCASHSSWGRCYTGVRSDTDIDLLFASDCISLSHSRAAGVWEKLLMVDVGCNSNPVSDSLRR